jgi:hypothetical protein
MIERKYYPLPNCGYDINELVHLAAHGIIQLYWNAPTLSVAYYKYYQLRNITDFFRVCSDSPDGLLLLPTDFFRGVEKNGGTFKLDRIECLEPGWMKELLINNPTVPKGEDIGTVCKLTPPLIFEEMQIVIMADDLERLRSQEPQPVGDVDAADVVVTKPLTKLEKQQAAISEVIKAKQFEPMAIPDGEKGTIQSICECDPNYSELFKAETAFDRAWKKGINTLWKMEHYESYARRGNY